MLRLFRHIRQRLFFEGRVSRYFGYAVGEIVLIVVGIMIALEANEWKEERRNHQQQRKTLQDLKTEFESIQQTVTDYQDELNQEMVPMIRLYKLFGLEPITLEDAELEELVDSLFITLQDFQIVQSVYSEELNSGRMSLIKNEEIRGLLSEWAYIKERALDFQNEAIVYSAEELFAFTFPFFPWKNTDSLYPEMIEILGTPERTKLSSNLRQQLQSLEFENLVNNWLWYLTNLKVYLEEAVVHSEKITNAIQAELANN